MAFRRFSEGVISVIWERESLELSGQIRVRFLRARPFGLGGENVSVLDTAVFRSASVQRISDLDKTMFSSVKFFSLCIS